MEKFNAPPGWPKPPQNWMPKPGWKPEPSWAKAPDNWDFWVNEWGEPVAGPPGLYGSSDVDATTAFNPETTSDTTQFMKPASPSTQAVPIQEKTGVIANAMQASRERGAERAAAEARGTTPHPDDDDSARKAVKWVAGIIVASVVFLALLAAFFHRSSNPAPAKTTPNPVSSSVTPRTSEQVSSSQVYSPTTPVIPSSTTVPSPTTALPTSSAVTTPTYTQVSPSSAVVTQPKQTHEVPVSTSQAPIPTAPTTTR